MQSRIIFVAPAKITQELLDKRILCTFFIVFVLYNTTQFFGNPNVTLDLMNHE